MAVFQMNVSEMCVRVHVLRVGEGYDYWRQYIGYKNRKKKRGTHSPAQAQLKISTKYHKAEGNC